MILNTYAVLAAFIGVLRLVLGVLVLGIAATTWGSRGRSETPEGRVALEDRGYLVLLLTVVLVGLNLVSWPLLYLLLQSYVPEWPGVMCIYGVTQIGRDSLGPSRHLPALLQFLQVTKPALVFAGGAWFVLYLLDRRTQRSALRNRLFAVLLPLGLLASADAASELAYLAIPKKEVFPSAGCCTEATTEANASRFLPPIRVTEAGRPGLYFAYYGTNLGLVLALFAANRRPDQLRGAQAVGLFLLGGVLVPAVSGLFLFEVAAPTLLGLPYHHCAYDLIPDVPEAVVAVLVFVVGWFSLGWACVARWFGSCHETESLLGDTVHHLLRGSLWGFLASMAMLTVELALA